MDYKNGKIYSILNSEDNEVYVGSTTQSLVKRFSVHRGAYREEANKNRPLYKHMNELGFDRFYIKLVEEYPCENFSQLSHREGHFIREIGTLNKRVEGRTVKEYRKDNRDEIAEQQKQYRKDNREEIAKRDKQYYKDHKDGISEQQKQYYKDNKEMIAERKGRIFECPCGGKCRWGNKAQHFKTKKHLAFVAQQNKWFN